MRLLPNATALILSLASLLTTANAQSTPEYKVTRQIELGGEGGWDYLTFDSSARRLYIARATRVMVVDTDDGKLVGEIPGTSGVHGVALVPKLNRGVTSNGRDDSATIFDLKTLKPIATVKTGGKPDAIMFDKASGYVITFNGRTNNATLIDPEKAVVVGTIALPGRPETGVSDGNGTIFVNLEDKNQVAVINLAARKVSASWSLEGCEEPTGLAMDLTNRRLFSGCHNGVLIVVDADTGKNIQKLPTGKNVDAAAFDPATQLIFTSNGEGSVSVVKQDSPTSYHNLKDVPTHAGAKTMALDLTHHTIYTVANLEPAKGSEKSAATKFGLLVVEP